MFFFICWRANIVVKLFTTIGLKSWLVNLLRNMLRIFQDIPYELLRKCCEQFPGNSQESVLKNFSLDMSAELVTRNSLEMVTRNSLNRVMRIFLEWVTRSSSDLVTKNSSEQLSSFSPDFPIKNSWEFPRIPSFLRILDDFPQNCYLGCICGVTHKG